MPDDTAKPSFRERIENNLVWSAFGLAAIVAGGTWTIAERVSIEPKEAEIRNLQFQNKTLTDQVKQAQDRLKPLEEQARERGANISGMLLANVDVFEGASVTALDGSCTVAVRQASDASQSASLEITTGSDEPKRFPNVRSGTRVSVKTGSRIYYIDLHRIRGNIAVLSVSWAKA